MRIKYDLKGEVLQGGWWDFSLYALCYRCVTKKEKICWEGNSMKITKIIINNFRLLKNTEIDLEKELSLIIGKNNCGKTSVLTALAKFLGDQYSGSVVKTKI